MAQSSQSSQLSIHQTLLTLRTTKMDALEKEWPELAEYLASQPQSSIPAFKTEQRTPQGKALDDENFRRLLLLLQAQATLPPQAIAEDQQQTFESLLSDWLNFSVTCQPHSKAHTIPYHCGKVRGLSYPSDSSQDQQLIPEAGISTHAFSWPQHSVQHNSDYSLFVHPSFLTHQLGGITAKPWFLGQKAVIINPRTLTTIVVVIADVLPERTNRYQFGVLPGVMRAGSWYTPDTVGTACVFYTSEDIPVGSTFVPTTS